MPGMSFPGTATSLGESDATVALLTGESAAPEPGRPRAMHPRPTASMSTIPRSKDALSRSGDPIGA